MIVFSFCCVVVVAVVKCGYFRIAPISSWHFSKGLHSFILTHIELHSAWFAFFALIRTICFCRFCFSLGEMEWNFEVFFSLRTQNLWMSTVKCNHAIELKHYLAISIFMTNHCCEGKFTRKRCGVLNGIQFFFYFSAYINGGRKQSANIVIDRIKRVL